MFTKVESILLKMAEVPFSKSFFFVFCINELSRYPYHITQESSGSLILKMRVTDAKEYKFHEKGALKMQKKQI